MLECPSGRSADTRAVADFLVAAGTHPSGLVIEGEAGIGKTTLWLTALEQAEESGFDILSAQPGQDEAGLQYTAIADLLSAVSTAELDRLPEAQRVALDRVLLRAGLEDPPTDHRVVSTALLTIVEHRGHDAPVMLAVDDVQWLDDASKAVLAFIARRLKGRAGVLVTERLPSHSATTASWLRLCRPDGIARILLHPMDIDRLRELFVDKLGRAFPRPVMQRFVEMSGGNPYFALELARTVDGASPEADALLPTALAEAVRARIGSLTEGSREMLLATACAFDPTVDLLARATGTTVEHAVELLEVPESQDILMIDGNHVRFAHPVLARGVYTDAAPARRRAMHAALAKVEPQPEQQARHLALACTTADPVTLRALDDAAEAAHARGDSATAAELVEAAIRLGGDTSTRRVRAGGYYFQAGDNARARALIEPAVDHLVSGPQRAAARSLLAEMQMYDGCFTNAVALLRNALCDAPDDHTVQVQTLLLLALALIDTRELDEARLHVHQAVLLADELESASLSSQALAMAVTVDFLCGQGVDERRMMHARELEDSEADVPVHFRASTHSALVLGWTGMLNDAHSEMADVRARNLQRGNESRGIFVSMHSVLIEIWRGDFAGAASIADEALERAEQIGGYHLLALAHTTRTAVAAYTGRPDDARAEAEAAMDAAERCSTLGTTERLRAIMGFLEVSTGDYVTALATMQPLLSAFTANPCTEIVTASFLPDAIEAMIAVGQLDTAEPLIDVLETNGRRLDRPWMLAVGARCRSMWLAANGEVAVAEETARLAMRQHDRLPMPFERARTQLLVGQLLRRQRRKEGTSATLLDALTAFEQMGNPLWADRTRAELARTRVSRTHDLGLTPSEQRVAELAASGMTNRDVAAALFISPKTVEHNLARAYRKLDIHSRAELGQRISQLHLADNSETLSAAEP